MALTADKLRQGAAGASTGGYEIDNSLRFNADDSSHLTFTTGTSTDRKKFTIAYWMKRTEAGNHHPWRVGDSASGGNETAMRINGPTNEQLLFLDYQGAYNFLLRTNRVFRDHSAWYHICGVVDTTQATASDRVKLYINGVQETSFHTATYPSLNFEAKGTQSGMGGYIGDDSYGSYFDGYLADFHFIDGQALSPSDFGETGYYGEWKPIEYSGTYGTNGFYLNFAGGGVMSATGGNSTTTDGDYKAASFTSDGTFTPSADGYVEYLVIAGGGGGGSNSGGDEGGGGGGAGGYRTGYLPVTASTAYSITVGDGGLGRADGGGAGGDGGNSVFSTITSIGGGGGSATDTDTARSGGSGGGMGSNNSYTAGAGTSGQGNAGGVGHGWHGGGGGGAGQVGGDYNPPSSVNGDAGNGGNGLASSITGSSVTRAGGGGGGTWNSSSYTGQSPGTGGLGGGGAGGATNQGVGSAGTANTGGGGGGSGNNLASGAGGSGIVIIRYKFQ